MYTTKRKQHRGGYYCQVSEIYVIIQKKVYMAKSHPILCTAVTLVTTRNNKDHSVLKIYIKTKGKGDI